MFTSEGKEGCRGCGMSEEVVKINEGRSLKREKEEWWKLWTGGKGTWTGGV